MKAYSSLGTAAMLVGMLVACNSDPAGPEGSLRTVGVPRLEIVVPGGGEILVDGVFSIAFVGVTEDSRCPVDVVCVWEGDAAAAIELTMGTGPTHAFTLHTALEPNAAEHAGYRVGLLRLDPLPRSGSVIEPGTYRATLSVEAID